jgi:hypothetical protein
MKKLLIVTVLLSLTSCIEQKPFKKPFIIFDKNINVGTMGDKCFYQYQDVNGRAFSFYDVNDKYSVGDTIK